ncbi:MAG: single-stranded-DNA-specific exonuclease RecJ [Myxococcota bacterium]
MTLHDTTYGRASTGTPDDATPNDRPSRSPIRYVVRRSDVQAATDLGRACGLGAVAAEILMQRGLSEPAAARTFLDPKLGDLSSPEGMADRALAADRLAHAVRRKERICVFGDYDVDGTTSAAILSDVLTALGGDVTTFVANRFEGGYGFSMPALERCLATRPDLIVTCDVGSSDHERIARAREAGVDVIVVDHHLVPPEPLPALAFLNPHRPECEFPYKGMCSAGLVFSLSAAIRASLGAKLDLRAWLDLVALGTVADVAPLDGDNRTLVRAGLRLLASPKARPGIAALRQVAGIKPGRAIGAMEIAFRLAPRLNAPGRLGDPGIVVALLRERDRTRARALAAEIEARNNERKAIERRTTEEAIRQVAEVYGEAPETGVVVAGKGWHRGVVGISAARVVDRFDVPAVVVAVDEDGVGHGSARTPEGIHLYNALSTCKERLIRFGGHAAAAGVTLEMGELDEFREGFSVATPRPEARQTPPTVDVELSSGRDLPSVADLMRLEPLGEGNAQPLFALKNVQVDDVSVVADGQHLKLRLRHGMRVLTAFGRDMASEADQIGDRVTVVGYLRPDLWRGGDALEMSIHHLYLA